MVLIELFIFCLDLFVYTYVTFLFHRCKRTNVNIYLHRFENQGRHTGHTNMLVWIKEIPRMNLARFKATIPQDHSLMSYLVIYLFVSLLSFIWIIFIALH